MEGHALARLEGLEDKLLEYLFNRMSTSQWNTLLSEPLAAAAESGNHRLFANLRAAGADYPEKTALSRMGMGGRTMLGCAAYGGSVPIVVALLQEEKGFAQRDVPFGGKPTSTPLLVAAQRGAAGVVDALLNVGADQSLANERGVTPLHAAAMQGQLGCVSTLLRGRDIKATINAVDDKGKTAVYMAVMNGHNEVTVELIRGGASPMITPPSRAMHLHVPAALPLAVGHLGITAATVEALLAAQRKKQVKKQINKKGRNGDTPLHVACKVGRENMVDVLLRHGADETLKNFDEKTPGGLITAPQKVIQDMLSRAPADRVWRRRGWLVVGRALVARNAQGAVDEKTAGGLEGAPTAKKKTVNSLKDGGGGSHRGGGRGVANEKRKDSLANLLHRVVSFDADHIFRVVVRFL